MDVPLARDEVRGRRGRIGGEDGGGADQRGELSSDPHEYEHLSTGEGRCHGMLLEFGQVGAGG